VERILAKIKNTSSLFYFLMQILAKLAKLRLILLLTARVRSSVGHYWRVCRSHKKDAHYGRLFAKSSNLLNAARV